MAHVKDFMQRTVYTDVCRSGHKNHTVDGRVPTLWPGSALHYLQAMQDIRGEDWRFSYSGNRFSFLGNGISHAEFDPTSDLAYYIREQDDAPPLTRRGRMSTTMRSGSHLSRDLFTTHRPSVVSLSSCVREGRLIPERNITVGYNEGRQFRSAEDFTWVARERARLKV